MRRIFLGLALPLLACITVGAPTAAFAQPNCRNTANFDQWLAEFKREAAAQKIEEADFVMIREGRVYFEGTASELRNSTDPYLQTFLS